MKIKVRVKSIVMVLLLIAGTMVKAQKRTIIGKVTAFKNYPIEKAEIKIKKSKVIAYTDSLGMFRIECQEKDKLSIKAAGFKKKWVKVRKYPDSVNVDLVFLGRKKDIELAIGYGHISKKKLGHAIAVMDIEKQNNIGYTDILEMMKGKIAGVSIVGDEVHMRGKKSFTGSNAAIVVLNGMVMSTTALKDIPVDQVKSITVLKGTAAAIYGSRGANGVIVVKLK